MTPLDRLFSRIADENAPDRHQPEHRHINFAALRKAPTFEVSRVNLYRGLAAQPVVQAMGAWGERLHRAHIEGHDPGDEDRER